MIRKYDLTNGGYNSVNGAVKLSNGIIIYGNFDATPKNLPKLDRILSNDDMFKLFGNLIDCATGYSYQEKVYIFEDNKPMRKEIITKKVVPDLHAVNVLINNYGDEPKLEKLIKRLKRMKANLEMQIS